MVAIERRPNPADSPFSGDGIPAGARRYTGSARQVLAACCIGAVILGLLSPPDLPSLTERFGDGPLAARLRDAASEWDARIARLNFASPRRVLHRATQWLIERQWP